MGWIIRLTAVVLLVMTACLGPLAGAPSAQAATPEIVVSTDGVNFAPTTSVELFDDLALIVPGDSMSGQLWVRNQSGTSALVRVAVTDLVVPSPAFGAAVTLSSTMNGFTYASTLGSLSDCKVVVEPQTIAAGDTARVDFDVLMSSATSGSDAQGETASLGFIVTAHDWAAGPFPDDNGCTSLATGGGGGNAGGTAPSLPYTGTEVLSATFVAIGLVGLGTLFAVLRRKRQDKETRRS
ncbi:LPXTG cell wall anchor domain-containing protein [Protaetiibacter intestinalis]|nr:LPXTG cell wall anchor domain-containing protein [Protaetiibacter intestinalis]